MRYNKNAIRTYNQLEAPEYEKIYVFQWCIWYFERISGRRRKNKPEPFTVKVQKSTQKIVSVPFGYGQHLGKTIQQLQNELTDFKSQFVC
jgi:hypothetical protein